jgi:hypothetical protein
MGRARNSRAFTASLPRLFKPGDLMLRPTGVARLRALARMPQRPPTERERLLDEDRNIMSRLRAWGTDLGGRFGLAYKRLDPEKDGVTAHYGVCYEDGVIRIRLRHATTGRLLKESSLVDTLCHELAHLKYMDHSPSFRRLYLRILDTARELGYYRPGRQDKATPRQLGLFAPRVRGAAPAARSEDGACSPCSKKRSGTYREG